jgi:DUF4097 and DUF4098 domain-containing protein YvlB
MRHAPAPAPHGDRRGAASNRVLVWTLVITGLVLLTFAAALRADAEKYEASANRKDSFNASGVLRSLAVETVNGSVEVVTGPSFLATVDITVKARTQKVADRILKETQSAFSNENGELVLYTQEPGIRVRRSGRGWSIHGDFDTDDGWRVEARYRITLPPSVTLNASVVNGAVVVKGVTAAMEISSVNGKIEVAGARRDLKVKTVNGNIDATVADLPKGARLEAGTVNGNIVLRLPAAASFRFQGTTMSGDISSTFALPAMADVDDAAKEQIRAERDRLRSDQDRLRREIREKQKDAEKTHRTGDDAGDIRIDLSALNEAMAELSQELDEMGREIAQNLRLNLNRSYEGTVGGGAAEVKCSNLNGRIVLLAEGTTEAQAKSIVSPKMARMITIPHFSGSMPRVVILPLKPFPPPEPPEAPRAPLPPRQPRAPEPPDYEGGSIVKGDVDGDFHSSLPVGDVTLGKVSGTVKVTTGSGQIRVQSAGKGAEVSTAGGDVRIEAVTGDLKASTNGGDIHVGGVTGDARLETSGGDVIIRSCSGAVTARTGGGDLTLKKLRGPVKAHTSGGTVFCEVVSADKPGVDIFTSGGDVTLFLPANYKADVEIRVTGVDGEGDYIVSQFPEITVGKRTGSQTGEGKLNGGGPRVIIRSTSGTVTLKKGPAA